MDADGRIGAHKGIAVSLAAAIRNDASAEADNAETIAEEFLAGFFSETGPATGEAFWRTFPVTVAAANRLFGTAVRRHWGLQAIAPDFTLGSAHLREGTFAVGQAIRAMVALHGWDYSVNPVGPDRIDRAWRRLLHFRQIVPHLDALLMPAIEKAHIEPRQMTDWRKALRRAVTERCAEEISDRAQCQ